MGIGVFDDCRWATSTPSRYETKPFGVFCFHVIATWCHAPSVTPAPTGMPFVPWSLPTMWRPFNRRRRTDLETATSCCRTADWGLDALEPVLDGDFRSAEVEHGALHGTAHAVEQERVAGRGRQAHVHARHARTGLRARRLRGDAPGDDAIGGPPARIADPPGLPGDAPVGGHAVGRDVARRGVEIVERSGIGSHLADLLAVAVDAEVVFVEPGIGPGHPNATAIRPVARGDGCRTGAELAGKDGATFDRGTGGIRRAQQERFAIAADPRIERAAVPLRKTQALRLGAHPFPADAEEITVSPEDVLPKGSRALRQGDASKDIRVITGACAKPGLKGPGTVYATVQIGAGTFPALTGDVPRATEEEKVPTDGHTVTEELAVRRGEEGLRLPGGAARTLEYVGLSGRSVTA